MMMLMSIVIFSGCKKKEGCMDRNSYTYDSDAEVDDGSCQYKGSIVFYYDKSTADSMYEWGITSLTFYVDNELVGSSAATVYAVYPPNCGDNGSVTYDKDLGSLDHKISTYQVLDQDGYEVFSGLIEFNGNVCAKGHLIW